MLQVCYTLYIIRNFSRHANDLWFTMHRLTRRFQVHVWWTQYHLQTHLCSSHNICWSHDDLKFIRTNWNLNVAIQNYQYPTKTLKFPLTNWTHICAVQPSSTLHSSKTARVCRSTGPESHTHLPACGSIGFSLCDEDWMQLLWATTAAAHTCNHVNQHGLLLSAFEWAAGPMACLLWLKGNYYTICKPCN